MTADELARAITEYLRDNYPGEVGNLAWIHCHSGKKIPVAVPSVLRAAARETAPPAPEDTGEVHSCKRDIIAVIESAGKRFKRDAVVKALADQGKRWGESTVWKHLGECVRDGLLTRTEDEHGNGYGPPEWGSD